MKTRRGEAGVGEKKTYQESLALLSEENGLWKARGAICNNELDADHKMLEHNHDPKMAVLAVIVEKVTPKLMSDPR